MKLVKESLNEQSYNLPEDQAFAASMYELEEQLQELDPKDFEWFEKMSGIFWRKLGVEDWTNAFSQDYMGCMELKDRLKQMVDFG